MSKVFVLFLVPFVLCHCALAPFTASKTGRPLGDGNWEVDGMASPGLGVSVARGFADKLDAGVVLEAQLGLVLGLWGKYSFIDGGADSISLAGLAGVFTGSGFGGSRGYYLGPVASYRWKWIESYLSTRYNYVSWDASSLNSEQQQDSIVELVVWRDINFDYLQSELGFSFWIAKRFAINLNAKVYTFFEDDSIKTTSFVLPGISFILRDY